MTKFNITIITDSDVDYQVIESDKCFPASDYSYFRFENDDGTLVARIVVSPRHTIIIKHD